MASRGGLKVVGAALDGARPAPKVGRRGKDEEQRELPLLPAGCPVKPLGKSGQTCHYLDEQGQMISLSPRDHGKMHIISLFGRRAGLVHEYWPRLSDKVDDATGERKVTGWKPEIAGEILQTACAHAGPFDPQGKVRGRGAWRGPDGELIIHHGDKVYLAGNAPGVAWAEPDVIDGFVYPTAPAMPRPDVGGVGDDAGVQLLGLLRCWHWERPKIDPYLLLGFIAAAPFGGALDWRPHVWATGDSSTGKSTLEKKLLAPLFDGLSLRTHDATEASIRQILGKQTLPVFFDELEAEANNDRAARVIKLARLASSEGVIFRGGSDHQATEFVARSCFYFTSILMPAMLAQDRNRMAILELRSIPNGAREPMLERSAIVELGKQLRRRVIDQWDRYDATLASYRRALAGAGHKGRGADQFGTLLAFADLLLYDGPEPEPEVLTDWAEALKAADLAETADNRSDAEDACEHLARWSLQLRGGDEPEPLTRFLERALGRSGAATIDVDQARRRLENHGMKIVRANPPAAEGKAWGAEDPQLGDEAFVAIATSNNELQKIFRDTRWSSGVWSQTFGRVRLVDEHGEPRTFKVGAQEYPLEAKRRVQVRIAGKSTKATLVPIAALLDEEGAK
jgi:hypothetical protein